MSEEVEEDPRVPRSQQLCADGVTPVVGSSQYALLSYWEARFAAEAHKEWLCDFAALRCALLPLLLGARGGGRDARILIVGNGNSELAAELSDAGFSRVVASDFSAAAVARMRARHAASHPRVRYLQADMLDLAAAGLARASFDCVVDKAAMDAVLADGGDAWRPRAELLEAARRVCSSVAHVLAPGGVFVQLSFSQPHFRRRFLLQRCGGQGAL
jgi:SAM-dependent methyltransferase